MTSSMSPQTMLAMMLAVAPGAARLFDIKQPVPETVEEQAESERRLALAQAKRNRKAKLRVALNVE